MTPGLYRHILKGFLVEVLPQTVTHRVSVGFKYECVLFCDQRDGTWHTRRPRDFREHFKPSDRPAKHD